MHRLILTIAILLAACTPAPDARGFRAADAPIYSSTAVDPSQLTGVWTQVAGFAPAGLAPCAPGQVDFTDTSVRWALCLADGVLSGQAPLIMAKPGRFAVQGLADWWVLWVDGDARTLVIGTPSGEFGFVLNRGGPLPADRLTAVRDILRFNGYATENMVVF